MTCPVRLPLCTACGCAAGRHRPELCEGCFEDMRKGALHEYTTEEVSTMTPEVYDSIMNKCYRCGYPIYDKDDGPCRNGFYYCYDCILQDKCGCCTKEQVRGRLTRIWNAIRRRQTGGQVHGRHG